MTASAPSPRRDGSTAPGARMLADLLTNHLDPGYAAASRRRDREGPPPPLERRTLRTAAVLAALVIGVVLAIAYEQAVARAPEAARTRAALARDVDQRSERTDRLQRSAETLREQVAQDRADALAGDSSGAAAVTTLRELEAVTGLGRVAGPGVLVRLADGPPPKDPVTGEPTSEADLGRIQDRDLQDVVNALWASGAEAISINGQRLAATSAIRSAGGAVLVDFRPVGSPYSLRAIGNPDLLPKRFDGSAAARRFRGYEQQYGMSFSAERDDRLELPAAPAPELAYARPVAPERTAAPTPSARGGGSSTRTPTTPVPSATGGRP
ncbi:MAG: hypothetical protein QOC93_3067 [Actinomycetota bacterium]|jgi:uncharacterized protein YlxW (UPF0749 family)|nr:hypothetical protein [Cryptosporangiaceae bacterium]MDQ1677923.1 hypothetical protein [Actinomycetota bacterium]